MNLQQLNQTYGDFYVPTFVVKVGADDVVRDLFLTVTGVEVDLKDKGAGHFSFTVASAFDWETREFVAHRRGAHRPARAVRVRQPGRGLARLRRAVDA